MGIANPSLHLSEYFFKMMGDLLPRYLRVAQWLLEQRGPVSSRDIAKIFNVSSWAISSDFAKICRQPDIFECREMKKVTNKNREHILHVFYTGLHSR